MCTNNRNDGFSSFTFPFLLLSFYSYSTLLVLSTRYNPIQNSVMPILKCLLRIIKVMRTIMWIHTQYYSCVILQSCVSILLPTIFTIQCTTIHNFIRSHPSSMQNKENWTINIATFFFYFQPLILTTAIYGESTHLSIVKKQQTFILQCQLTPRMQPLPMHNTTNHPTPFLISICTTFLPISISSI